MKYIITLAVSAATAEEIREAPGQMGKVLKEMIGQIKPEAIYFSTIRRLIFMVVNIGDPHVELRTVFDGLSRFGETTIDPVSSMEEFSRYMEQL